MLDENFTAGIDIPDKKLKLKEDELYQPDEYYCGDPVFHCSSDVFHKSLKGKKPYLRYKTYVGEDEIGQKIRGYSLNNPKKSIILKDNANGTMIFFRRKPQ